jgi:hypothetical protein
MAQQIQLRNDTAANWASANPTLAIGEVGVERGTGQFKIGNGSTAWNSLAYGGIQGPTGPTGPTGAASTVTGPTGPTGATGPLPVFLVSERASNYTLQASDADTYIYATAGITITIPNVLSVGQSVNVIQDSSSQVTFTGSSITLRSKESRVKTNGQYSGVAITCKSSGVYYLIGDLGI